MAEITEAQKEWFRRRVEAIHDKVTAYDVLRHNGIELQQANDDTPEQISCPFHGKDTKPSARVYPEEGDSRSHVWCYVCQETGWDAIGLWRKFNGGDMSFSAALTGIEKVFGLETPPIPRGFDDGPSEAHKPPEDEGLEAYKQLYLSCERRLLSCRGTYQKLGDMYGYLAAGSVLDKVRSRVDSGVWDSARGRKALQGLLVRIREKVAACPGG